MTINNSLSRFFIFGVNCLLIGALTLSACSNRQRQAPSNVDSVSATASDSATSSRPIAGEETCTIDENFFNSLVDTVSCHYLSAYVGKIKPGLRNEFNKPLKKEELNTLLNTLKSDISIGGNLDYNIRLLWDSIDVKRNSYHDYMDKSDDELIGFLLKLPSTKPQSGNNSFQAFLSEISKTLKNQLTNYLGNNQPSPSYQEQRCEADTIVNHGKCKFCGKDLTKPGKDFCKKSCDNRKHERDKKKGASDTKKTKRRYFLFGLLTGAVGMGVVLGKRYKSENSQLSKQSNFNEELLKAKENKINELQKQINQIRKEKNDLLEDNIALGKEMDELKAKGGNNRTVSETIKTDSHSQTPRQSVPSVLFADSIVEECLIRVQEVEGEDSVFELHLKTPDTAEFVICARANQRIVANPSFIEGCDKQVLPNATNIEIVAPGAAHKDPSNGKWIVTKKLKVNIR